MGNGWPTAISDSSSAGFVNSHGKNTWWRISTMNQERHAVPLPSPPSPTPLTTTVLMHSSSGKRKIPPPPIHSFAPILSKWKIFQIEPTANCQLQDTTAFKIISLFLPHCSIWSLVPYQNAADCIITRPNPKYTNGVSEVLIKTVSRTRQWKSILPL